MSRVSYSPEALNDLNQILSYISEELKNHVAAQNTVDNILDSIEKLSEFPEIGTSLNAIVDIESDYRFLVCGNYLAFYRLVESEVKIDRILFSSRDYIRILLCYEELKLDEANQEVDLINERHSHYEVFSRTKTRIDTK